MREQIGEDMNFFYQTPFGFYGSESVPSNLVNDTYLWCMLGETRLRKLLFQSIEVGTRISIPNQFRIMETVAQQYNLGQLDSVLLLAKGSGNGLGAGKEVFGSPIAMVREEVNYYLNITP
jgi:hypothetical protein